MKDRARYGIRRASINALALCALTGAAVAEQPPRLAVFGDSLIAGYGLAAEDTLPVRLEAALRARGIAVEVLNAGVSGDTTAGGLARLDWMLADRPDRVIVALGANDALRGLEPAEVEANLTAIVERLRASGAGVLIVGMLAPPNLGRDYESAFNAIFPRLAAHYGAPFHPFLLDGVAAVPALNQTDGIHPNPAGIAVMVERLLPLVVEWLSETRTGPP